MKKIINTLILIFSINCINAQCYNLVWADEFSGTSLDNSKWSYQIGAGGWGNNELQYYTDRVDNTEVSSGTLKIIARSESYGGANYTSARIRSINKGDWTYGRMEASIKLPVGQGIWPAFWMMPTESVYGIWPQSGEIDIMEYLGHQTSIVHGTCHYGNSYLDKGQTSGSNNISPASYYDGAFHTFAVEWEPTQIRWYVDGTQYVTFNAGDESPYTFPFDQDFHFILNIAVGGNWPGNPDGTTVFPQTMEVDYVRVYQELPDIKIRGDELVLPNETGTIYTVPNIASTTYSWTVPSGATITAGSGTNQITVDWGDTSGNVEVTMNNACGNQLLSLPVTITINHALNPGFEEDLNHWQTDLFNGAFATWNISTSDVNSGAKAMCANVSSLSANVWDIQISPVSVDLENTEDYTIEFWAKADVNNRTMSIALINSTTYAYYTGTSYTLTDSWAKYSHNFTSSVTANASINLQFGHELGTFCIDDFVFARTGDLTSAPVELLDFQGEWKNDEVVLDWQTASEINFSHFVVQRSEDGRNYNNIADIQGRNAINGADYFWTDYNPNQNNYYRLKQVDLDESFEYSKAIHIIHKESENNIQISPTLAHDIIEINSQLDINYIKIFRMDGQMINYFIINNKNNYQLDISNYQNGLYFLKVNEQIFKFIKT